MQKETRINLNTQFGNYMKSWNVDVIRQDIHVTKVK